MTHNKILMTTLVYLLVPPVLSISAASKDVRTYATVYAQQYKPTGKYPRNTLQGDFVWAARSSNLRTAAVRWKHFLSRHSERELDSAIQPRLVSIAKYELMRVYYLLGNVRAADQILKELDPLKLLSNLDESMNLRLSTPSAKARAFNQITKEKSDEHCVAEQVK